MLLVRKLCPGRAPIDSSNYLETPSGFWSAKGKWGLLNGTDQVSLSHRTGSGLELCRSDGGRGSLEEINFRTMELKLVPGLYFVGEILDCDGRIGGFNFQWAWATGMLAGRASVSSR